MSNFTAEQRVAVEHKSGNILVSASAGSGKTYVMISRIIRLIEEGRATVDNILAVTFTSAAAEEMKEKLTESLIKAINDGGKDHLKAQLKKIMSASVSTIHSFCKNLLKNYFFHAEVDAGFEIIEENRANALKNQALNNVFEKNYAIGDKDFLKLIDELVKFRADNALKAQIIKIYEKIMSYANPLDKLSGSLKIYESGGLDKIMQGIVDGYKESLTFIYSDILTAHNDFLALKDERRVNYTKTLLVFIEQKLRAEDYINYFLINEFKIPAVPRRVENDFLDLDGQEKFKFIKKQLSDFINDEKKFYSGFDRDLELKNLTAAGDTARRFIELLKQFTAEYERLKNRENVLDFDDLQHKTLKLLENDEVLQSVKNSYSYIFTDEYQDVNELQESILNKISDNNLFMVGDLKQSIYAFRGCNPEFFAKKFESFYSGTGKAVSLNHNFRSSDGVIGGVNNIFDRVMTPDITGIDYKKSSRLKSGGLYPENTGQVNMHLYLSERQPLESQERRVYDIMQYLGREKDDTFYGEGAVCAEIISNELGKQYFDIKSGEYRTVDFSDIVILAATRTHFEKIEQELVHCGIPVNAVSKDNVLYRAEVILLIDILKVIDNREQDIPLTAFLKMLFDFSEDELAKIRLFSDAKTYRECIDNYKEKGEDALSSKLAAADEYLREIRVLSEFIPAGKLLGKIIAERQLELKILAQKNGDIKIKRMARFLNESVSGGKKLSCAEFLNKVTEKNAEINISLGGVENAVRLMTIHSSKGLEYPIVILANSGKQFILSDEKEPILIDNELNLAVKSIFLDKRIERENILRTFIKQKLRSTLAQDQMRLLYVALTRAKWNLHIVGSASKPKEHFTDYSVKTALNFLSMIPSGCVNLNTYTREQLHGEYKKFTPKNIIISQQDERLIKELIRLSDTRYKYVTHLPIKAGVTGLTKSEEYYKVTDLFGTSSAEKGTAYHHFLEKYEFDKDFDSQYGGIVEKIGGGKLIDRIKAKRIVEMPVFKDIDGASLYREQPFLIKIAASEVLDTDSDEPIIVQGIIDLLAISNSGVQIIDYKMSRIENIEDLAQKYKKQLNIYKIAAERILKRRVDKLTIINILSESVINI